MTAGFRALLHQASNDWRDHILTALTLILIFHLFVVTPLALQQVSIFKALNAAFAIALTAGLFVLARSWISIALLLLFVGLLALSYLVEGYGGSDSAIVRIRAGAWLLMALAISWIIVRAVYAPGPITYHRVVGAVFLYLCIGLFFAALYAVIGSLTENAFSGFKVRPHPSLPAEVVYFSFVTLTTVGYGDLTPVDALVRGLSNLEAIIGQLYPATILARLVASEVRIGGPGSD